MQKKKSNVPAAEAAAVPGSSAARPAKPAKRQMRLRIFFFARLFLKAALKTNSNGCWLKHLRWFTGDPFRLFQSGVTTRGC
jgi:hypothetical protein